MHSHFDDDLARAIALSLGEEIPEKKQHSEAYQEFVANLNYVLGLPSVEINHNSSASSNELSENSNQEERDLERAIALSLGEQISEEQNSKTCNKDFLTDLIEHQRPTDISLSSTLGTMFSPQLNNPAPQAAAENDDEKVSCKPSDNCFN